MSSNKYSMTAGIGFLILSLVGFFWLWYNTSQNISSKIIVDDRYKTVEVESLKDTATSLLSNRGNVSGMPISTPVTKMGRDNPFSSN